MMGFRVCSDLSQGMVDKGLFIKRPPNVAFKTKRKVKINKRKVKSKSPTALTALVCPPTFSFGGRQSLTQDSNAHTGKVGHLETGSLPDALMNHLGNDLIRHPWNDGGIPGLTMGPVDSGASATCVKSKAWIPPDTHEESHKPISLGGIASGLEIIGRVEQPLNLWAWKGRKSESLGMHAVLLVFM